MKRLFLSGATLLALVLFSTNLSAQDRKTDESVRGGILNGKAVKLAKPVYPPKAKAAKAQGAVNVRIVIDEKGDVVSAKAVSGHSLLRAASEKAARASKFSPTRLDGKAVKVSGILVYNFSSDADEPANRVRIPKHVRGGVLNGKAISLPRPEYPAAAKAVRASGVVNVLVTVSEDGNVESVEAVSGHPLLRSLSEKAAREAKFSPTILSGNKVKITGVIVYNFAVQEE